ncbi:hypothetical protein GCM10022222_55250 [Amycolatopsis ultiminotia]|uniref:Microcin J25-processing protein McjB C-terminal domain-containing protein n=1 Tax=Amycolatopsis ultiminotia TaxID=543629 RepID=A0ABP6XDC1_9PSEU
MTIPVLPDDRVRVSVPGRLVTSSCVAAARVLAGKPPGRIRAVLTRLRAGARPATMAETAAAREEVLTVSPRCCGSRACVIRSLAVVLRCRLRGTWPTWCVGVLAAPPFAAHAWVEAEGEMVDEALDGTLYRRLITIGPDPDRVPEGGESR